MPSAAGWVWENGSPDMTEWTAMVEKIKGVHRRVEIALVGKYTGLRDAYLSVAEALFHAGTACDAEVEISMGGFRKLDPGKHSGNPGRLRRHSGAGRLWRPGNRGHDPGGPVCPGKGRFPTFGICLGMQIAVDRICPACGRPGRMPTALNLSGSTASSPVIALMPEQVGVTAKGRHHAAGAVSLPFWRRGQGPLSACTGKRR